MGLNNTKLVKKRILSLIIIWWLIWGGFIGIMVFKGIIKEDSLQALNIIVDCNGNGDYSTIQEAIDAANPGDTIQVWSGTYDENITINTRVILKGNSSLNTTIDGYVRITTDYVNVTGFKIIYADIRGIYLINADYCEIFNNSCSQIQYGIYLYNSHYNKINKNEIFNNDMYGIYFDNSDLNLFKNNTVSNQNNGIFITNSVRNTITNNYISNNYYGIVVNWSNNNTVENNNITNNYYGININNSQCNTIRYNEIFSNDYGIYFEINCYLNTICYNLIISNTYQAINNGSNNWDDGTKGNYWSDYYGLDNGANGRAAGDWIGDTNIPHLGLDYYPFIQPFGWLAPNIPVLIKPTKSYPDGNYTIYWFSNNNTTGFILQEAKDYSFQSHNELYNGSNFWFTVTNRHEGAYYYRLKAYNEYFITTWSKIVEIKVIFPIEIPKNLRISVCPKGNALNLSWDLNKEKTKIYELFYQPSSQTNWKYLDSTVHPQNTYNHSGLIDGIRYYYKLRANDSRGYTSEFTNIVGDVPNDSVPPEIPTGLTITEITFNTVKLSWNPNIEYDFRGYNVYRSKSPNPITKDDQIGTIVRGYEKYTDDEGLEELSTYYYALSSYDEVPNESEFSDFITVTTTLGPHGPEINHSQQYIEVLEDTYDNTSINLYYWFKDVNSDKLRFECTGQEHIQITIFQENGTVILVPETNWNGQETLTFTAYDIKDKVSENITIIVLPINDPPELVEILSPKNGSKFDDGIPVNFSATATDPDLLNGDKLTFKWLSSKSNVFGERQNLSDILLSIGVHLITFEVSDIMGKTINTSIYVSILETPESDTDGDGMPNVWERVYGLKIKDPSDAEEDPDEDGLSNIEEYYHNTEPNDPDTDGDGHKDGEDVYPMDRARWKDEGGEKGKGDKREDSSWLFAVVGVVIVIVILFILFFFFKLSTRQRDKVKIEKEKTKTELPPNVTQTTTKKETTQPEPQDVCITCGQQLFYDKEQNKFYCHHCKKYE